MHNPYSWPLQARLAAAGRWEELEQYKDELKGRIGHSGAFGGFLNLMTKDLINDREVILLNNNGRLLPIHEFGNAVHHILREEPYIMPKVSIHFELRKTHYNDIEGAIVHYQDLKGKHPSKYKFNNEWELNALGYALMADKRIDDAIKIFKLLISEFPDRPNPRDSLGEAYYLNGQYELSIQSYEKALEIDESYNVDWIREMLEKNQKKLSSTNYSKTANSLSANFSIKIPEEDKNNKKSAERERKNPQKYSQKEFSSKFKRNEKSQSISRIPSGNQDNCSSEYGSKLTNFSSCPGQTGLKIGHLLYEKGKIVESSKYKLPYLKIINSFC